MSYDIPREYERQIAEVALAQHISTDEALDRIIQAGLERLAPPATRPPVSYSSLFGAAKSGYGSRESIDLAISEMRNEL